MIFPSLFLLAAMSSSDAIAIVLNSKSAASERTFETARETVEREARDGQPIPQFVVGVTTDDRELAKFYLEFSRGKVRDLAERENNALAWYLLAMEKNDLALLKRAADGGNVQALNALGTIVIQMAQSGGKLAADRRESLLAEAYGYFRSAALQRDPNGFINLGTCYLRGIGCKMDRTLAFSCFRTAAEAGHPEGMDNMSACYQFGHGVEKNDELCLYWAMRGRAVRGDAAAAKWLKERK